MFTESGGDGRRYVTRLSPEDAIFLSNQRHLRGYTLQRDGGQGSENGPGITGWGSAAVAENRQALRYVEARVKAKRSKSTVQEEGIWAVASYISI